MSGRTGQVCGPETARRPPFEPVREFSRMYNDFYGFRESPFNITPDPRFLFFSEAQDLGTALLEQVRLLSNLETDQRKLLQIVLIGQPELREKLNEKSLKQLRQRITVRYHLTPLSREETERYVFHRLKVAG